MKYEELLLETDSLGILVKEKPLKYNDGRQKGNRIAIRQSIATATEKACVLSEELGHYYTSTGDILDQTDTASRKQEYQARFWAYNRMVGLCGIIECYKAGCCNIHEMAEYLEVTEEFMKDTIEFYRRKYGQYTHLDNYIIVFEPNLSVMKMIHNKAFTGYSFD